MKPNENKPNLGPIKNTELEKVIQDLKQGSSPEKQVALIEALKNANLLSPCDFDEKINPKVNKPQQLHPQQIKFYLLNTNDGKTLFPAFTDFKMTDKTSFGPNVKPKFVVRTIKDYDTLLSTKENKASGIVINPGQDNIVIPSQLIAVASGRSITPSQPTPGTAPLNVRYGELNVYPTKMVNAIYDRAEKVDAISRVWLRGKYVGPTMSFYIVVEANKKEESVLNEIREVAVPMAKDIEVEVVFVNDQILKDIIGDNVALYDKDLIL